MIIPCIDLMGGAVVQLVQGREKALDAGPLDAVLKKFAAFPVIQVIDLDAAIGSGSNESLIERIAKERRVRVGGGIRTKEKARRLLDCGAEKVMIGTAAFRADGLDHAFLRDLNETIPREAIQIALDSRDGRIVVKGWRESLDFSAAAIMGEAEKYCGGWLCTYVDKEGMLQGTDLEWFHSLRAATSLELTAAGGITSYEEVRALQKMNINAALGMAVYTGRLDLTRLAKMSAEFAIDDPGERSDYPPLSRTNLVHSALLTTYPPFPFPLVRGKGDCVFDDRGRRFFDFYGGHCVCSTGHAHPKITEAIARQSNELLFYSSAADVPVRTKAAERLIEFANSHGDLGMRSVFFCNSGSEANENALKIAAKITKRKRFAAFEGGWHGRGTLPLSVTDDPKISGPYTDFLAPCSRLPWNDEKALDNFNFNEVAAVILEPIQSMAGVRAASPSFLAKLRERTSAAGALLILDEIQTGIGRLGAPFAAVKYGMKPDMISSAKGIASGVPMGAVLMTEAIAAQLKPGDLGSTFGGSPLACAALLATLDVIESEDLMNRALAAEKNIRETLRGSCVTEILGTGLLLGLRIPARAAALKKHLQDSGILVGGSSDAEVLRLMPPLNISDEAIDALTQAVGKFS
ncbi:MAG: aminotransferase class III-fold pyridoxal phosphate-dependent enzyme [Verrucomicrobiota bacterium]|nr:aminotransferase class III-fold pyridoxal phosphate-dependent enzyme [Verrucomicrobiota bacterium]